MSTQPIREATDHGSSSSPRQLERQDGSSTVAGARDEQINEIVERLSNRYTREQISVVDLKARVGGFHHQFDGARLRSFVAILVEGLARRSIAVPVRSPEVF